MSMFDVFRNRDFGSLVAFKFVRKNLFQLSRFEGFSFLLVNDKDVDALDFSTAFFGNDGGYCYVEENSITLQFFESSDATFIHLSAQGNFAAEKFIVVDTTSYEQIDVTGEADSRCFYIAAINTSEKCWMDDFEYLRNGLSGYKTNESYMDRYKSLEIISVNFLPSVEEVENSLS